MTKALVSLAAVLAIGHTGLAADDGLSGSLSAGIEYNDNLTVEELDLTSASGGLLSNIDASLGWQQSLSRDTILTVGYDFSTSLHFEDSEFDFLSHGFSAGLEHSFDTLTMSVDYSYFDTRLDGDGLLDMHIVTPAVALLVNRNLYLQADYSWYDKNFDTFTNRSAETSKYGLSGFWFFNDAKSYWKLSAHRIDEDAVTDALDYKGTKISTGLKLPADGLFDGAVFKTELAWSDRSYKALTDTIMARREEDRWELGTSLEVPVWQEVKMVAEWNWLDRKSNLAAADYTENRLGLRFKYSF